MGMQWEQLTPLHKDYILDKVLERLQGTFVGNMFIPERPVGNFEYSWLYYGEVGGMTPEVHELDIGPLVNTAYEKRTSRIDSYKERTRVSVFAREPYLIRNASQDAINNLSNRAALRLEALRIRAIVNGGFTSADDKGYYWKDCDDDDSHWVGGTGIRSIRKDCFNAIRLMQQYAKMTPDTIIVSPEVATAVRESVELAEWQYSGPISQDIIKAGVLPGGRSLAEAYMGRLYGLDWFVVNASILSDNENPRSPLVPLLDRDAYIFKRGEDLGALHVFQGIKIDEKDEVFSNAREYQISMMMKADIFRPQFIHSLINVVKA